MVPFSASAQNTPARTLHNFYVVAEAGVSQKSVKLSTWTDPIYENSSGESFGGSFGYRAIFSSGFALGLEINAASAAGTTHAFENTENITIENKAIYGNYLTLGMRFERVFLTALVGVGGTIYDSSRSINFSTIKRENEQALGLSFGATIEFGLSDDIGIRIKALYTGNERSESTNSLRLRDNSVMGGIIFHF